MNIRLFFGWRPLFLAASPLTLLFLLLAGCSGPAYPPLPPSEQRQPFTTYPDEYLYLIGPGDKLSIVVWGTPEASAEVTVRPDGRITTPLVTDLEVTGKTAAQLSKELELILGEYIRNPIVSVLVSGVSGPFNERIRVLGEASRPLALPYAEDMTLLDLMIRVGGITEFAAGNRASIVRVIGGEQRQYGIRIDDLLNGDMTANVDLLPGDIIIVPESWF